MKFSYDGHGLNDAEDPYKPRLLTFERNLERSKKDEIGKFIESAPQKLAEALSLLKMCEAYLWNPNSFPGASEVVDGVRQARPTGTDADNWRYLVDFIKENGGYDR